MAFIRRGKLKKKQTIGYKVVVVVGDDSTENLVNTVDVAIPTVEGQPVPSPNNMTLPLKVVKENGNKRFVFSDLSFSEDAVNYPYEMISTMKDSNNKQVGEPLKAIVEVEDDGDSRVRSVSIRQLDETNFRLKAVIVGDSENNVDSVDIICSDFSGPEPIPVELTLTNPKVIGGKKVFKNNTFTFDDPAAAADEVYVVIVDLKNKEGASIGSTEYTVVVEGLEEA
ncbi:hypothetical protein [Aureispira anguillae]|uniref:Uncharacterized protein n=1 Tax=Aureispira anguillae TaxID=2864201 RepID=A0A916DTU4_9BACT|nr:hypothetical protein [Aureispira anguillae]BDS12102.1 hypothetical protein AsAng_0028170 [Aureispira anguillae]